MIHCYPGLHSLDDRHGVIKPAACFAKHHACAQAECISLYQVDALQKLLHSLQGCIQAGKARWQTAIAMYITAVRCLIVPPT